MFMYTLNFMFFDRAQTGHERNSYGNILPDILK
jgi:hypothetical protein